MSKVSDLKDHKDNMTPEQKAEKAWQYAQAALTELERRIELAKQAIDEGMKK